MNRLLRGYFYIDCHTQWDRWSISSNMIISIEKSGVLFNPEVPATTNAPCDLKSFPSAKILGVLFTKNLNFDEHCLMKAKTLNKRTGSLTKFALHRYGVSPRIRLDQCFPTFWARLPTCTFVNTNGNAL